MAARSNLPWGLNRGHPTTVIAKVPKPSNRKGKQSARSAFVKSVVREVAGFAPYERRVMELIRNSKDKKARKLTKKRVSFDPTFYAWAVDMGGINGSDALRWKMNERKRLGTLRRAKRKVDELTGVIAEQRRHAA
ncbi:ribosomal protein L36 [Rhodotorula toruloides]